MAAISQPEELTRDQALERLKPRLTPDFLATLAEAARVYGWQGDLIEVERFVDNMHECAGVECPEIEPYDCED